jgi:hypothetical protein
MIPTEVTVAVAVETAVAIKTVGVKTPDDNTTGDRIKIRVDQLDGSRIKSSIDDTSLGLRAHPPGDSSPQQALASSP